MNPKKLQSLAKRVKLLAMDVDGVLTGGEIIMFDTGGEIKIWDVKDRMAFHLIDRSGSGIKVAWITGRSSRQVADRAKEIGIHYYYHGSNDKIHAIKEILAKEGLEPEEALYIGDDILDIPVFRYVGFAICPSDAPAEVKKEADFVSRIRGGKGVVREVIELVLKARGFWKKATEGYI
ncbi:MAG: HAD hydrolase family protein [Endomicrobiales bacterium]|nr:HAD hydrolase family protein [Endomicrobiales bacterium]